MLLLLLCVKNNTWVGCTPVLCCWVGVSRVWLFWGGIYSMYLLSWVWYNFVLSLSSWYAFIFVALSYLCGMFLNGISVILWAWWWVQIVLWYQWQQLCPYFVCLCILILILAFVCGSSIFDNLSVVVLLCNYCHKYHFLLCPSDHSAFRDKKIMPCTKHPISESHLVMMQLWRNSELLNSNFLFWAWILFLRPEGVPRLFARLLYPFLSNLSGLHVWKGNMMRSNFIFIVFP